MNQKLKWILSAIVLIVLLWLGIRSCTTPERQDIYRIGRDSLWPGIRQRDRINAINPFSDQLLFSIAQRENLQVHLYNVVTSEQSRWLQSDALDGVLTTNLPEISNEWIFSEPYYALGSVLVVKLDTQINGIEQFKGKNIALQRGLSIVYKLPPDSQFKIVPYDSMTLAIDDLLKGWVEGVIMDQLTASSFVEGFYRNRVKIGTNPLTAEGLRLMAYRKDQALIDAFNSGLQQMKDDGSYFELLKKWGLPNPYLKSQD